jgi:hypothetical protein
MVPHLLLYQLLLVALVLIYFLLSAWWPDEPPARLHTPLKPDTPRPKPCTIKEESSSGSIE